MRRPPLNITLVVQPLAVTGIIMLCFACAALIVSWDLKNYVFRVSALTGWFSIWAAWFLYIFVPWLTTGETRRP